MPPQRMPAYFEKYLDEKFGRVYNVADELKGDIKEVKNQVKKINGNIKTVDKVTVENKSKIQRNAFLIKILGCSIVGLSFACITKGFGASIIELIRAVVAGF